MDKNEYVELLHKFYNKKRIANQQSSLLGRGAEIWTRDFLHPIQRRMCPQRITASIMCIVSTYEWY